MPAVLHRSRSANDIAPIHMVNAQDAGAYVDYADDHHHHAHSDDEVDMDMSSVDVHPDLSSASSDKSDKPVEIAFSASAGAFVYQMGVAAYIQDHFDTTNCHFSGCSGGSWAATLLAAETSVHKAWEVIQETQRDIIGGRTGWYQGYGRYANIVATTIENLWKDDPDVHKRVEQRKLAIAVTKFPSMKAEKHTSWEDLDDLKKTILASAMIPFALSGKPCITHRGNWYVDGGITNFKGINCDQYSTLSDVSFHAANLVVDSIRATTNAISDRFFPSLTKPVARLVNYLLPQFESPHDAIAPRRLTNSPENPQTASATETTADQRQRLIIKPWTWRTHSLTAFHLSVDIATHQARFDMGYDDARTHHHELAALLPRKQAKSC